MLLVWSEFIMTSVILFFLMPSGNLTYSYWKMTINIVSFPIHSMVIFAILTSPEGRLPSLMRFHPAMISWDGQLRPGRGTNCAAGQRKSSSPSSRGLAVSSRCLRRTPRLPGKHGDIYVCIYNMNYVYKASYVYISYLSHMNIWSYILSINGLLENPPCIDVYRWLSRPYRWVSEGCVLDVSHFDATSMMFSRDLPVVQGLFGAFERARSTKLTTTYTLR